MLPEYPLIEPHVGHIVWRLVGGNPGDFVGCFAPASFGGVFSPSGRDRADGVRPLHANSGSRSRVSATPYLLLRELMLADAAKIGRELFLTPRVKFWCADWALPSAGSEPAGGLYKFDWSSAGGAGTPSSGRGPPPRPRGAGRCPLIASSSVARTKIAMEGSERASH